MFDLDLIEHALSRYAAQVEFVPPKETRERERARAEFTKLRKAVENAGTAYVFEGAYEEIEGEFNEDCRRFCDGNVLLVKADD